MARQKQHILVQIFIVFSIVHEIFSSHLMDVIMEETEQDIDNTDVRFTDTIVALLMDPIILTHQAINLRTFHSNQALMSASLMQSKQHYYRHTSPSILEEEEATEREQGDVKKNENERKESLKLKRPLTPYPIERTRSSGATSEPSSSAIKTSHQPSEKKVTIHYVKAKENSLYLEILRDTSIDPNLDNLYSRIQNLSQGDLLDLLHVAYIKSGTKPGLEVLEKLLNVVSNRMITTTKKSVPDDLYFKVLEIATKSGVPFHVFALVCTHINLLSEEELNDLVFRMVNKHSASNFERFNAMILEITWNLNESDHENYIQKITLLNLEYVKAILDYQDQKKQNHVMLSEKIKMTFASTILLTFLKANLHKSISLKQFKEVINKVQDFACNTLKLNPLEYIKQIDSVSRIYYKNESSSPKNLANFLVALHEVIVETTELPSMPDAPPGFEDVYFYVKNFMPHLLEARVLYYQFDSTLNDEDFIKLLVLADSSNIDKKSALLMPLLLSKEAFLIAKRMERIEDLRLSLRLEILLKSMKSFPESSLRRSDLCSLEKLPYQEKKVISWSIPDDVFLNYDPKLQEVLYKYLHAVSIIPSLFLCHVVGIPYRFTKVKVNSNEILDAQEIVNIINFFLKRWCSIKGEHTKISVKNQIQ